MSTSPRRPSAVVTPLDGEAFDGYIERSAATLGWPPSSLYAHTGLDARSADAAVVFLAPESARAIEDQWRVARGTITSLTLFGRYPVLAGEAPRFKDIPRGAARKWFFVAGSRYCPDCLGESGLWHLDWRLPWAIGCREHRIALVDSCPRCGGWPRSDCHGVGANTRQRRRAMAPWLCHRPVGDIGRHAQPCGADLSDAPRQQFSLSEAALQERILGTLQGRVDTVAGVRVDAGDGLRAWIELALIGLSAAGGGRRRQRLSPPRATATMRDVLAVVAPVGLADDARQGAEVLRAALDRFGIAPDQHWLRDRLPSSPSPLEPVYEYVLRSSGRVSTQLRRYRQQTLGAFDLSASQIPQLAWPCSVPPELARVQGGPSELMRRAFVSLSLARVVTGDWEDAAEALAFPPRLGNQWSRYVIGRVPAQDRGAMSLALMRLIGCLPESPVSPRHPVSSARELDQAHAARCRQEDAGGTWCPCSQEPPDVRPQRRKD